LEETRGRTTRIVQARANGLALHWIGLDDEGREIRGHRVKQAKDTYKEGYTKEELQQRYENMAWFKRLPKERQELIRKNQWDAEWDLTDEERQQRIANIVAGQLASEETGGVKCFFADLDGVVSRYRSTWEYPVDQFLYSIEAEYDYADRYPGTALWCNTKMWNPDFIVEPDDDIYYDIIEVKGKPEAYHKFYEKDLPAFFDD